MLIRLLWCLESLWAGWLRVSGPISGVTGRSANQLLWASADRFSETHGLVSFAALRAPGPFYFGVIGVDRAAANAAEHLVLRDIRSDAPPAELVAEGEES